MKTAKRYPFRRLLEQRLRLHVDNRSSFPDVPRERQFRQWVWQAAKLHYRRTDIGLVLLDEEAARQYNRDYRGKDYATNVLSFETDWTDFGCAAPGRTTLSGDLVICPQVVAREAAEQEKSIEAHFAHLTVHGVLHLMGCDHQTDSEAEEMEALEIRILNQLGYPNPYRQDEY